MILSVICDHFSFFFFLLAWDLVPRPKSQRVVDCKWIYKVKEGVSNKDLIRFKARLVAKDFTYVEGVKFYSVSIL